MYTGLHVALVMDGNGRWATRQGLSRLMGHCAGAKVLRPLVEIAPSLGVGTLTLFGFSSDNWKRPEVEVAALFALFERYLASEAPECARNGVRLSVIGRRDRLPNPLVQAIDAAEELTRSGRKLHMRLAVDFSGRDAIVRAAASSAGIAVTRERFAELLRDAVHAPEVVLDVDLMIRTGGEQRLSDFLLWECAYAEFVFLKKMWPEFTPDDLRAAVSDFLHRERRFGTVPETRNPVVPASL